MAQGSWYSAFAQGPKDFFVHDTLLPDTLLTDTLLPIGVDSLPDDSLRGDRDYLQNLDSIRAAFDKEHQAGAKDKGAGGTLGERARRGQVQWNDSVAQVEDSLAKHRKKSALDDPVAYEAKDSIVFMMGKNRAYLYGDANVDYQNISL